VAWTDLRSVFDRGKVSRVIEIRHDAAGAIADISKKQVNR